MYNDYMQNLLGSNFPNYQNTYDNSFIDIGYSYNPMGNYFYNNQPQMNRSVDLESLYPEIYKIIYPMVQKACLQITGQIDASLLDNLTNDIYNNLEGENVVNLNINIENTKNESTDSNNSSNTRNSSSKQEKRQINNPIQETRQINNPIRDLIKILLIRELLRRQRPNRPPRPMRPMDPMRPTEPMRPTDPMRPMTPFGNYI